MNAINFNSLNEAIDHANAHGGWIMRGITLVMWFDAAHWTISKILAEFPGSYEIGTRTTNWRKANDRLSPEAKARMKQAITEELERVAQ